MVGEWNVEGGEMRKRQRDENEILREGLIYPGMVIQGDFLLGTQDDRVIYHYGSFSLTRHSQFLHSIVSLYR